jgi:hypothetical protein
MQEFNDIDNNSPAFRNERLLRGTRGSARAAKAVLPITYRETRNADSYAGIDLIGDGVWDEQVPSLIGRTRTDDSIIPGSAAPAARKQENGPSLN